MAEIDDTLALRDALRATLIDTADIAALADVQVETVRMWRWRGVLPEPALVKSGTPLWLRDIIINWLYDTGRLAKEETDAT